MGGGRIQALSKTESVQPFKEEYGRIDGPSSKVAVGEGHSPFDIIVFPYDWTSQVQAPSHFLARNVKFAQPPELYDKELMSALPACRRRLGRIWGQQAKKAW